MNSIKTIEIACTAEALWKALTESEYTKKYMFNCSVETDWKVGSSITWQGEYQGYKAFQKGEVLEYKPSELIKYSTFDPNFGLEDKEENYIHVTYELSKKGDNMELKITNETFDGNEERMGHIKTGWDMVMSKIKEVVER